MDDYIFNNFYSKSIEPDRVLITADHGDWALLSKADYDDFIGGRLEHNSELFMQLRCKGFMLDNRNARNVMDRWRSHHSFLFSAPTLHVIAPTRHCTQACIYCMAAAESEDSGGKDMDMDTAKQVVDFIMKTPAKQLKMEFTGGEPLLNFDVVRFMTEYSHKRAEDLGKKVSYCLVTNLRKMDDDILRFAIKYRMGVGSSLDGPKHLHERQRISRDGKDSYENVIYWFQRAKEFKYHIGLSPVITRYSLPYWKEIVDEYVGLDAGEINVKEIFPVGFAVKNRSDVLITGDELFTFWKNVVDYLIELNKGGVFMHEAFTKHILKRACMHKSYMCIRGPCGAALSQLSYDYRGDIRSCDGFKTFDDFILGNVTESDNNDIMLSKKALVFRSMTKGSLQCDYCFASPYCGICHVNTYGEQGNIVPKLPSSSVCRFRKKAIEYIFKKMSTRDSEILMSWLK